MVTARGGGARAGHADAHLDRPRPRQLQLGEQPFRVGAGPGGLGAGAQVGGGGHEHLVGAQGLAAAAGQAEALSGRVQQGGFAGLDLQAFESGRRLRVAPAVEQGARVLEPGGQRDRVGAQPDHRQHRGDQRGDH